ncbi:aminoglycoside phosphotransferase [Streptomyces hundungensis]|uniref:aminoglycoside phosphotransferase n=1 Tax=Streptomyces hundungensis TaxID=1077946 RepID=UPI0033E9708A
MRTREPRDGANCGFAALLTLADGRRVFVKGQPDGGPLDEFDREESVNRVLPRCAPRVLWRLHAGGWHLMGFEGVDGERAAYEPDSPELGLVVEALTEVGHCVAPRTRLMTVWDRWGYYCEPADRAYLSGLHLLHTDPAPQNFLIDGQGAHLVDWAWPALGPAWVDAALWGVRLMSDGGQGPEQAHRWVSRVPAWSSADPEALRVFTRAEAASWSDAAREAPEVANIAQAAQEWANYWR